MIVPNKKGTSDDVPFAASMSWEPNHIGPPGVLAQLTGFTGHVILICGRANINFVSGLGCDRVIVSFISWDNHHHWTNPQGFELVGVVQAIGGKIHSKTVVVGFLDLGVVLLDLVLMGICEAFLPFVGCR